MNADLCLNLIERGALLIMVKNNPLRTMQTGTLYSNIQKKEKMETHEKRTEAQKENKISDRVEEIQKAIQKGEYQIDLKKTSEKMALNLLNL